MAKKLKDLFKDLKKILKMMHTEEKNINTEANDLPQVSTITNDTTNDTQNNELQEQVTEPETKAEAESDNLADKIAELNDKYLRLYSEFDNYKKRTAKERIEFFKTAASDIFLALLPVLDDFDRALKSIEQAQSLDALKEGIELIHHKLQLTLSNKGLTAMESIGKDFDVELHEAITNVPASSEDQKGKIVDEVEKGYFLNGKVIRYAKVVVAN